MIFILVHGSWHTGNVWYRVEEQLGAAGFQAQSPTLSGFTPHSDSISPSIGLHTNIGDIVQLVEKHDLKDVILVGHSYSGLVISGVAEQIPHAIAHMVFLDAFIPESGQSLFDIIGADSETYYRGIALDQAGLGKSDGVDNGWLLPPGTPQDYGVTEPEDVDWLLARLVYSPLRTFEEALKLENPKAKIVPRTFIRCTQFPYLAAFEEKAKALNWDVYQIDAGHDAMLTAAQDLSKLLIDIGKRYA